MQQLNGSVIELKKRPVRVLQFGEGNFLRAFTDWIIQTMNDTGVYETNVAVVQPMPSGRVKEIEVQDGLYTVYLEGIDGGKTVSTRRVIDVLSDFINPYTEYEKFLSYAISPDLDIVISNTTEAGIALDKTDTDLTVCPKSFPAKLLALLKKRYEYFNGDKSKGLIIIPCELIDYNGRELKRVLLELSAILGLDGGLVDWLSNACRYTSTLVDRIVPGYPSDDIAKKQAECGYVDTSAVKGEVFHLWVLERDDEIMRRFPADKCGLNVIYADDITPYKQRKVKILNGSHTALVPVAYLSGLDTVREAVENADINRFVKNLIYTEINPTINLPKDEMKAFADSVLERYLNPFIRHELMSIALNGTTKFTTRLLPTLKDYININGSVPKHLLFGFAALIVFYKGDRNGTPISLKDNPAYLERWKKVWQTLGHSPRLLAGAVCGWSDVWECNISLLHADIVPTLAGFIEGILKKGARRALEEMLNDRCN